MVQEDTNVIFQHGFNKGESIQDPCDIAPAILTGPMWASPDNDTSIWDGYDVHMEIAHANMYGSCWITTKVMQFFSDTFLRTNIDLVKPKHDTNG